MKNILKYLIIIVLVSSCSSFLKYKKDKLLFKNSEFENKVNIVEAEETKIVDKVDETPAPVVPAAAPIVKTPVKNKKNKNIKTNESPDKKKNTIEVIAVKSREPDIENAEGLGVSRRPLKDPFRVGEVVQHSVSFLGASAGILTLKVNSFATVNGHKSYNFFIDLKSNSFFSNVYAVDDQVQTYVDYETLVPRAFKLNIRDSGQVKEAQSYFDNDKLRADYWEHRYSEKGGHEEKKINWTILPFSQNPFSAIFYMRIFNFVNNNDYTFRVADDEKNVIFKAHVIGRTELNTDAGKFKAIKLKAEIYTRGNLGKASDFYIWLSDDDRKYILRIEVKLPIGSLVSEVTQITAGKPLE